MESAAVVAHGNDDAAALCAAHGHAALARLAHRALGGGSMP